MTRKPSLIVSGANAPYFTWLRDLWISRDACGAGALTDFGVPTSRGDTIASTLR
ncbi:MAG: hypothetical protein O3B08_01010 [Proteobacteria bacterium]|nr:hypothetical protein [Pseudomonadota bacterium]